MWPKVKKTKLIIYQFKFLLIRKKVSGIVNFVTTPLNGRFFVFSQYMGYFRLDYVIAPQG